MSRLTDPELIGYYETALSNYCTNGYVIYLKDAAVWLKSELPGWSQRRFSQMLYDFVRSGGEIDRVDETRVNWSGKYEYHYDLRPAVKRRRLYVETRLVPDVPNKRDDPYIFIVNIH